MRTRNRPRYDIRWGIDIGFRWWYLPEGGRNDIWTPKGPEIDGNLSLDPWNMASRPHEMGQIWHPDPEGDLKMTKFVWNPPRRGSKTHKIDENPPKNRRGVLWVCLPQGHSRKDPYNYLGHPSNPPFRGVPEVRSTSGGLRTGSDRPPEWVLRVDPRRRFEIVRRAHRMVDRTRGQTFRVRGDPDSDCPEGVAEATIFVLPQPSVSLVVDLDTCLKGMYARQMWYISAVIYDSLWGPTWCWRLQIVNFCRFGTSNCMLWPPPKRGCNLSDFSIMYPELVR